MKDERKILKEELVSIGISEYEATIIALDAGSSQTIVDIEYLRKIKIPKHLINQALQKITKFYFGYYFYVD